MKDNTVLPENSSAAVQAIFTAGPCYISNPPRRTNGAAVNPTPEQLALHLMQRCALNPVTGCWEWRRGLGDDGYGHLRLNGRQERVHRIALRLSSGIDGGDLLVMHSCDNPVCIRPSHLRYGTHAENMSDCRDRGRYRIPHLQGERHPSAKLTNANVREIRVALAAGETRRSIGRRFGVSLPTIGHIAIGHTWGSVLSAGTEAEG